MITLKVNISQRILFKKNEGSPYSTESRLTLEWVTSFASSIIVLNCFLARGEVFYILCEWLPSTACRYTKYRSRLDCGIERT
jgi:hypothetical protein